MVNLAVFYYNKTELVSNSSIYFPTKKENPDPLDICYLNQVKANLYNECGEKVGVFQALNSFRSNDQDGINTGIVTIKTNDGIISWINAYDIGSSSEPFLNTSLFTKSTFVSGLYSESGLDVYIKIINFNDVDFTRKIEVFY